MALPAQAIGVRVAGDGGGHLANHAIGEAFCPPSRIAPIRHGIIRFGGLPVCAEGVSLSHVALPRWIGYSMWAPAGPAGEPGSMYRVAGQVPITPDYKALQDLSTKSSGCEFPLGRRVAHDPEPAQAKPDCAAAPLHRIRPRVIASQRSDKLRAHPVDQDVQIGAVDAQHCRALLDADPATAVRFEATPRVVESAPGQQQDRVVMHALAQIEGSRRRSQDPQRRMLLVLARM